MNSYFQVHGPHAGVIELTMNRPERLNACSIEDHAEMGATFRRLNADPEVRAVVVTGAGRAFCVGGTFDLLQASNEDDELHEQIMQDARELVYALIDFEKVLVSAVNGVAVGPGAILALLSDFIIMEQSAQLADGHTRAALAAGDGGVIAWPLALGLVRAKRFLLTGDSISAEEAAEMGLITEMVDDGMSMQRARQIAKRLAHGPQTAIRFTKRALNSWYRAAAVDYFEHSLGLESLTMKTAEFTRTLAGMREGKYAISADE